MLHLISTAPDGTLTLLLVCVGLATIIGLIRSTGAWLLVFFICLVAAARDVLAAFLAGLPWWGTILLELCFAIVVIRALFGRRVQENVIAGLLIEILRAPVRLLGALLSRKTRPY